MKFGTKFALLIAAILVTGVLFQLGIFMIGWSFVAVDVFLCFAVILHYLDSGAD